MAGITWIYDLDDTLISNAHNYSNAAATLILKILEKRKNNGFTNLEEEIEKVKEVKKDVLELKLGFEDFMYNLKQNEAQKALSIAEMIYKIDMEIINRAKKNKFSQKRFPSACAKVYESYFPGCPRAAKKEAYEIGKTVFSSESPFKEGAENVLDFLKYKKDKLILLTKGDKEIQSKKIKDKKLERWFGNSTYIVDDKSAFYFQRVLDSEKIPTLKNVFSVGNSFKSDIEHALEIGLSGIYISERRWDFEKVDNFKEFITLKKISEIKDKYAELTDSFKYAFKLRLQR